MEQFEAAKAQMLFTMQKNNKRNETKATKQNEHIQKAKQQHRKDEKQKKKKEKTIQNDIYMNIYKVPLGWREQIEASHNKMKMIITATISSFVWIRQCGERMCTHTRNQPKNEEQTNKLKTARNERRKKSNQQRQQQNC